MYVRLTIPCIQQYLHFHMSYVYVSYMHTCICIYLHVCALVCTCIYMHECGYATVHNTAYEHMSMYLHICTCICLYCNDSLLCISFIVTICNLHLHIFACMYRYMCISVHKMWICFLVISRKEEKGWYLHSPVESCSRWRFRTGKCLRRMRPSSDYSTQA